MTYQIIGVRNIPAAEVCGPTETLEAAIARGRKLREMGGYTQLYIREPDGAQNDLSYYEKTEEKLNALA